ncbi:MAG: hypothetical protein M3348_01965 [Acidobacteriota bacterium]|nr:hypothetical protein [Acidobacteriota bacterium]
MLLAAALALVSFTLSCAMPWSSPSGRRSGDPLPRKQPPQGMSELPTDGVGRALTSRMSGTPSARKMLAGLLVGIDGYFDARPALTTAFADSADQNLQAAFTAKLVGVPVRGVMAIQMRGATGQATLLFDRWASFPQTFERLAQAVSQPAQGGGGADAPAQVQLTPTQLPDGSGRIGLPPGWRIVNSFKGTVDAVGPNGETMSLGGYFAVNSPSVARLYPTVPTADFSDPVRALTGVVASRGQRVNVIDARPVQSQAPGRWALIRWRANLNGQSTDGLGLYGVMPVDEIQGIFYNSYVTAPSPVFKSSLPAMWAAWQSWGVSNAVLNERLTSAASSMRETSDIIAGSYWDRQDTYAKVNRAWSDVMRDESVWRDPSDPNTQYRVKGNPSPADMGGLEPVPIKDLIP